MTLENYIMEQEINTASFSDVMLEQAIAEFEVSVAILECYQKEEVLLEYASNASEFNVFMEEDETAAESTKKTFKERLGDAGNFIKEKGKAGIELLKKAGNMLVAAIENFFAKVIAGPNLTKLAEKIDDKYTEDDVLKFNVNGRVFDLIDVILGDTPETPGIPVFINYLEEMPGVDVSKVNLTEVYNAFAEKYHKAIEKINTKTDDPRQMSKTYLVKKLKEIGSCRNDVAKLVKNTKAVFKDMNEKLKDDHQIDKGTLRIITSLARELTSNFKQVTTAIVTIVNKAEKDSSVRENAKQTADAKKQLKNFEREQKRAAKKAAKNQEADDTESDEGESEE